MKDSTIETAAGDSRSQWPLVALGALIVIIVLCSASASNQLFMVAAFAVPTVLLIWRLHEDRQRLREWTTMLSHLPIPFALTATPGFAQQFGKLAAALS